MAVEAPVAAPQGIALSGATGLLGRRVVRLLLDDHAGRLQRLVLVGRADAELIAELAASAAAAGVEVVGVAAGGGVTARDLVGVDVIVHLAGGPAPSPIGQSLATSAREARLALLRSLLEAADEAGVDRVVHLSSALVYGASPDNPIPLSEDSPLRPDLGFALAVELAEAERLIVEWTEAAAITSHTDGERRSTARRGALLRPALVVAPEDETMLVRALGGTRGVRAIDDPRPVQFVHIDDVATATVLAITAGLDGPFNVAPDGWIDDAEAAALAGAVLPRPALPARLVGPVRRLAWSLGIGATPPDAIAYATHPWVVASDRLRSRGWVAAHSNEEAIVDTTSASPLATLSPQRRQEILLAGVGVAFLIAMGMAIAVVAKGRRARRAT